MGRALALLLFLLPALAQTLACDAAEVRFDFGTPAPAASLNGHPVASLATYLNLLDQGMPATFLPTQVVGANQPHRVTCAVQTSGGGGGGGTLCGAGAARCLRITLAGGTLPAPLDARTRLLVQVQVVAGNVQNHAPAPTPLGSLPDNGGMVSVPGNTTATLWIWLYLLLDPGDAFTTLPTTSTLTLAYRLQNN